MADLTREEVIELVARDGRLAQRDLSGLDLSEVVLDRVDLSRSDLSGANLSGAQLRDAKLMSANIREAFLQGADLSGANLDKADLDSANLERSRLRGANLNRANLAGANVAAGDLTEARLVNAQLDGCNLGKAILTNANLSHADLTEAYLGGTRLEGADLRGAVLVNANLEEASFVGAKLDGADLTGVHADQTSFEGASLVQASLPGSSLRGANLRGADLRRASLTGASVDDADLTLAHVEGTLSSGTDLALARFDELDFSLDGMGTRRLARAEALAVISGGGSSAAPALTRYFGPGDILKKATLEFSQGSRVVVEGSFEGCSIQLGDGAELIVETSGRLRDCKVVGRGGSMTVRGEIHCGEEGLVGGISTLRIERSARFVGTVRQPTEGTLLYVAKGARIEMDVEAEGQQGELPPPEQGLPAPTDATVIDAKTTLRGDISAKKLWVYGRSEGEIRATELVVADAGYVAGNIQANSIEVFGTLAGNIQADSCTVRGRLASAASIVAASLELDAPRLEACRLVGGVEQT